MQRYCLILKALITFVVVLGRIVCFQSCREVPCSQCQGMLFRADRTVRRTHKDHLLIHSKISVEPRIPVPARQGTASTIMREADKRGSFIAMAKPKRKDLHLGQIFLFYFIFFTFQLFRYYFDVELTILWGLSHSSMTCRLRLVTRYYTEP